MTRAKENYVGFKTIFRKEVWRFTRIWVQTILPPVITTALYFTIFGHLIGPRIGTIQNYNYMQYIAPGLIMMTVINGAYLNVTTSFYMAKFVRNIEEILTSPTPPSLIVLGYVLSSALRGIIVGILVTIVALFFTHLQMHHIMITLLTTFFSACLFACAGFINGLLAQSWDDISIVPTFVLTPLTYFGGVFYSMDMLPHIWRNISLANPILYIVNVFRYGILGISDVPVMIAFALIIITTLITFFVCLFLVKKGVGIKK